MKLIGSLFLALMPAAMNHAAVAQIWPKSIPDFHTTAKDGISEAQAEYIVALTAEHEHFRVRDRRSSIERLTDNGDEKTDPFPGFFYFSIVFNTSKSLVIDNARVYYVSKMTGDVWDAATPSPLQCHRVSFPALRNIQKEIMASTGASFAGERSERLSIGCTGE